MYKILILLTVSSLAFGQGIHVKDSLATLLENAIVETGLNINIVPEDMTETSVNINTINNVSVCDPVAKNNVIALQSAFTKHSNLHQTISIYGVYQNEGGNIKFLSGDNKKIKELIGECKYLYVSVQ